jgi:two-component system, response regulator
VKPILLVEDNLDDVELTTRAFARSHILNPLVVARDGIEALDYLGLGRDTHDGGAIAEDPTVVLLDLSLPRLGGLGVLARMREDKRTRLVPVVILTSSKEEQDRVIAEAFQVNVYIRKPVDFDNFVSAAREIGLYWTILGESARPALGRGVHP